MSVLPSSSSSLTRKRKGEFTYSIFLSFNGRDTRKSFTDHLYRALDGQGIVTFKDDKSLVRGEDFAPELSRAIGESWGSIIIISEGYAFSHWCLKELVEILKQKKERGHRVYPIFYHVPCDFRHQINSVKEAFDKHEKRHDKETIEGWRAALKEVTDIHGWPLKDEKEVAKTMVEVAAKYHREGGLVDSRLKRFASAHKNAIVFTEADMCTSDPNHNKPLYVESMVNGMDVKRTFIDNGSGVNLMPLTTFRALNLDERDLRNPMTPNSFDNTSSNTLWCIMVNFKLANIHQQTCFHVIKADVAYHVLLGRKWLDSHYLLPSTLHQCIKGHWNGKEVFIPTTKAPFAANEIRYAEASFFDDFAGEGEGALVKPTGVAMPRFGEVDEVKNASIKCTRRGGKRKRGSSSGGEKEGEHVTFCAISDDKMVYYL